MSQQELLNNVINGRFENTQSTPLMRACANGNLEDTHYLIEKLGGIADILNKNDENCLILAVIGRQLEVVQYLCQKCVKPNGKIDIDFESSRNGLNALARAVLQNDFEIADVLVNAGKASRGWISKKDGQNILQMAQKMRNQKAVEYMGGNYIPDKSPAPLAQQK